VISAPAVVTLEPTMNRCPARSRIGQVDGREHPGAVPDRDLVDRPLLARELAVQLGLDQPVPERAPADARWAGFRLSHVDTLDTYLPITPASSPAFFEECYREERPDGERGRRLRDVSSAPL
jgi:hypothetical protein